MQLQSFDNVGLEHYDGLAGFGAMAAQEQLQKALSAGYADPRSGGGAVFRVESLEATLRVLTYTSSHTVMWKDIPKSPAFSTAEEYTVQNSYGIFNGAFTREGELPQVQDSEYERRVEMIKFIGTQREVTHPMMMVRSAHGNVIARQTMDGATWLLAQIERALFQGNSATVPESWDGIAAQMLRDEGAAANNVFDLRGGYITEDVMEEITNVVAESYGVPGALYLAPRANSDMSKQFYARQRTGLGASADGRIGFVAKTYDSTQGSVPLRQALFLRSHPRAPDGVKGAPTSATSARSPSAPTMGNAVGANAASLFTAVEIGAYQYKITAFNRFGESAPVASGTVTLTNVNNSATLTITDGGGSDAATGYRIYRSAVGGAVGTEKFMVDVPRIGASATTVFVDINQYLPNTSNSYLMQMNQQAIGFRQLAPMMKITLPTLALSTRWAQLLYGTPIIYAPRKHVMLINVKDD